MNLTPFEVVTVKSDTVHGTTKVKVGDKIETYLLGNGETAQWLNPKEGKRRFLMSSDPTFKPDGE